MSYATNIRAAFERATADDLARGLEWYEQAATLADGLGGDNLTREQVAGVIAAMSPAAAWHVNIMMATRLITHWRAWPDMPSAGFGLKRNVAKAWAILEGAEPLETLSGPKVRAFYRNILGDPHAVCVDRWAVRIARADPTDVGTVSHKEYDVIADAYREAALELDISPRDLQAATWTYFRRVHGRAQDDPLKG